MLEARADPARRRPHRQRSGSHPREQGRGRDALVAGEGKVLEHLVAAADKLLDAVTVRVEVDAELVTDRLAARHEQNVSMMFFLPFRCRSAPPKEERRREKGDEEEEDALVEPALDPFGLDVVAELAHVERAATGRVVLRRDPALAVDRRRDAEGRDVRAVCAAAERVRRGAARVSSLLDRSPTIMGRRRGTHCSTP